MAIGRTEKSVSTRSESLADISFRFSGVEIGRFCVIRSRCRLKYVTLRGWLQFSARVTRISYLPKRNYPTCWRCRQTTSFLMLKLSILTYNQWIFASIDRSASSNAFMLRDSVETVLFAQALKRWIQFRRELPISLLEILDPESIISAREKRTETTNCVIVNRGDLTNRKGGTQQIIL